MSTWPERVAKAVEEGTLYVTAEEYDALAQLMRTPGPTVFEGPGFQIHLNGILVVVDAAQAERQASIALRCLCVEFDHLGPDGILHEGVRSARLCPIHGPESTYQRLTDARHRLGAEIWAETLARLKPDATDT